MVQWLRICLPKQGRWVQSLALKISHAVEQLLSHSYWAHALESVSCSYWSLCTPEPVLCNKQPMHHSSSRPHTPQLEKAQGQQQRPSAGKINYFFKNQGEGNQNGRLGGVWTHLPQRTHQKYLSTWGTILTENKLETGRKAHTTKAVKKDPHEVR